MRKIWRRLRRLTIQIQIPWQRRPEPDADESYRMLLQQARGYLALLEDRRDRLPEDQRHELDDTIRWYSEWIRSITEILERSRLQRESWRRR